MLAHPLITAAIAIGLAALAIFGRKHPMMSRNHSGKDSSGARPYGDWPAMPKITQQGGFRDY